MRPGQQQQKNRMRGRGRKGPNPLSRNYESNGPDVKIRGSAQHVAEKYSMLARDASAAGDRVMAENYLQHAEHYNRIIFAAQAQFQQPRDDQNNSRDDDDDDDDDDNNFDNGNYSRDDRSNERNDRNDRGNERNDRNDRGDRNDRRPQPNVARDTRDQNSRDQNHRGENNREQNGRDQNGRDQGGGNRSGQRNRDDNGQRDRRDRNDRNLPAGSGPQPVIARDDNRANGHAAQNTPNAQNGAADESSGRSNDRASHDRQSNDRSSGERGHDRAARSDRDHDGAGENDAPIGMTAAEALEETQSRAKRRPRTRRPRLGDKPEMTPETSEAPVAAAETVSQPAPAKTASEPVATEAFNDEPKKPATRRKAKVETAVEGEEKPKRRRTTRAKKTDDDDGDGGDQQHLPDFLLASNG